jgi:ATP-binding cassette subfamily B protein
LDNINNVTKIMDAVSKGGAKSIVKKSTKGLNQWLQRNVFRDGLILSGGEKQKVAASRAYMNNKDILIFDEPASALDPVAEMEQFKLIKEKLEGKTAILISHRVGFARLADRIFVLDNGQLVEVGTHKELMDMNGVYAKLFKKQAEWYDTSKL